MDIKGWQKVLLIIVPFLLIVGIFEVLGMLIAGLPIGDDYVNNTIYEDLIVVFFSTIGKIAIITIFIKNVDKERITSGLKLKKWINLRGFLIYGFWVIFIFGVIFFLLKIFDEIEFVNFDFDVPKLLASILLFSLIAISEEFLMRGYVLKNLLQSFSTGVALILSSILFVLLHSFNPNLSWIGITNLFFAGLLLGLIYLITDSIWYPVLVHFYWNFFQTHLGFNISGQNTYSLIDIKINNESIFNGGQFGIEGSILSVFSLIIFSIILYFVWRRNSLSTQSGVN